ncbi:MAG: hypothetical protein ACQEP5_08745 [Actinomycetota bacterium]
MKLKPNQRDHFIQWLMVIAALETVILLVPVRLWLKAAVIGLAFLIGFLLRFIKVYPGAEEPLAIDIATACIAFLFMFVFIYVKKPVFQMAAGIALPLVILIPHIIYIAKNKDIGTPAFRKIISRVFNKK